MTDEPHSDSKDDLQEKNVPTPSECQIAEDERESTRMTAKITGISEEVMDEISDHVDKEIEDEKDRNGGVHRTEDGYWVDTLSDDDKEYIRKRSKEKYQEVFLEEEGDQE